MPTSVDIKNLKINKLTEAQYDAAVQGGVIGENELSVLTDAELEQIQVSVLPTASADELGNIYQYIGATDANYTNGYFYKCEGAGDPAVYSWAQVNVQPAPSGLPDQTGQSGKFLITDGTDASWQKGLTDVSSRNSGIISLGHTTSPIDAGINNPVVIVSTDGALISGYQFANLKNMTAFGPSIRKCSGHNGVLLGGNVWLEGNGGVAIGGGAEVRADGAIQISSKSQSSSGYSAATNSDANTFKVANGNGNYEMMSADGTIPTDRFTTTPVADGTYVPTLTIASGVATRTWGAAPSAPVVPSTMPELTVAGWSNNTQTVSVTGVTASNIVIVSPAPASAADYAAAGIVCTAQGTDSLTFTCTTVPSNAITVNVIIM